MSLPEPITRKEQYYDGIAKGNASKLPEPITREEQYLEYIAKNGGGGGGGTTDYEALDNKPSVNSVELSGNKTLDDLGIQGKLTFDNEPTEDSQNPVKSGGVYDVLESLIDAISEKPDEYADLTDKPSINFVELSGNKTASELGLQPTLDGAKTVSGNPITVADAESMNAESVVVELEPKQDLHGYDAPWVGGSGKNLLENVGTTTTIEGVTFTVNDDGSVTLNRVSSSSNNAVFVINTLNLKEGTRYRVVNSFANTKIYVEAQYDKTSGTYVASTMVDFTEDFVIPYGGDRDVCVSIVVKASESPSNVTVYPMLGYRDMPNYTYEPYSNICPISGYSEVNVERVGKNLWDVQKDANVYGWGGIWSKIGQAYSCDASSTTIQLFSEDGSTSQASHDISVEPSNKYCMTVDGTPISILYAVYYDASGTFRYFEQIAENSNTAVITIPNDIYYMGIRIDKYDAVSGMTYNFTVQIEKGETATTYEPYQGNTYTIDLDGTKYGGTLDVTEGVLTVDREIVDLGDYDWEIQNIDGNDCFRTALQNKYFTVNAICSQYSYSYRCYTDGTFSTNLGASESLYVRDSRYSDATVFKQAMNGVQLVYELATPLTIQLTPTQIQMLENTNNISTDGTNITLKYQPNNVIGECKAYTDEQIEKVLPPLPTTDGTYHLSCEVTSGVGVLSWVSDS